MNAIDAAISHAILQMLDLLATGFGWLILRVGVGNAYAIVLVAVFAPTFVRKLIGENKNADPKMKR